jgi:cytochrome c oxidase assembly protein subunit 11
MAANPTKSLVIKLLVGVVAMFGFGFALVPLYDVFCEVTGLNGKTSVTAYQAVDVKVDTSREVTVKFVATNNDKMSWEFKPQVTSIKVHPGELTTTSFYAKNPSDHRMVAQAIPSVSPGLAAGFFHKTECFCFTQQTLAAGESIEMPLRFIVDQDLPKNIHIITLAYTLFDVTERANATSKN